MKMAFISTYLLCLVASNAFADAGKAIARGKEIFIARCDYCHGKGPEKGAVINLEQKYKGELSPYITERSDLTAEYIRLFVRTQTKGMAPIRFTEINDEELDWLIAYLTRNNQN